MKTIRIAIADDHMLFREGLIALLQAVATIDIVGITESAEGMVRLAHRTIPHVILMDLQLPNSLEAIQRILSQQSRIGILVLTLFDDVASVMAAMRAGAVGYVLKGADQAEIAMAIQTVVNGKRPLVSSVEEKMHIRLNTSSKPTVTLFMRLTQREMSILSLMVDGATNQMIAQKLGIRLKTVSNHITSVLHKLEVANRTQAVLFAQQNGFLYHRIASP